MGELDGRVAVISGGTRGIGRAIAEAYLRDGAKVVVSGRDQAKGEGAIAEMNAGGNAHFVQADSAVREDCERLIAETVEKYGRIDILVNNAGGSKDNAPVAQLTDEAMDWALKVNLWSTFWCSRAALQHMIPQQWGRIINISSTEGKVGKPGIAIYVTAKHAVNGLTKSMAQEVGTLGITVNALCPVAKSPTGSRPTHLRRAKMQQLTGKPLGFSLEQLHKTQEDVSAPRCPALEQVLGLSEEGRAIEAVAEGATTGGETEGGDGEG